MLLQIWESLLCAWRTQPQIWARLLCAWYTQPQYEHVYYAHGVCSQNKGTCTMQMASTVLQIKTMRSASHWHSKQCEINMCGTMRIVNNKDMYYAHSKRSLTTARVLCAWYVFNAARYASSARSNIHQELTMRKQQQLYSNYAHSTPGVSKRHPYYGNS